MHMHESIELTNINNEIDINMPYISIANDWNVINSSYGNYIYIYFTLLNLESVIDWCDLTNNNIDNQMDTVDTLDLFSHFPSVHSPIVSASEPDFSNNLSMLS